MARAASPRKPRTDKAAAGNARARGRLLAHFGKLNDAEKELLAAAREGRIASFGDKIPESDDEKKMRTIRAEFVRFLALGGDNANPVHELGVRIAGVVIDGALDFEGGALVHDLLLLKCKLVDDLTLRGAHTRGVVLDGCCCRGVEASGAVVRGNFFMRNGFVAQGPIRLSGAHIEGGLECSSGRFEGLDQFGNSLFCDRLRAGSVALTNGFVVRGAVRLLGAEIKSYLNCSGGRFEGHDDEGYALRCDSLYAGSGVFLRKAFFENGAVRFVGAKLANDFVCSDSRLSGRGHHGSALDCDGVRVDGDFFLRSSLVKRGGVRLLGAAIKGSFNCTGSQFNDQDNYGNALFCDGLQVGGEVSLRYVVTSSVVRLIGADVGGDIFCIGSNFGASLPRDDVEASYKKTVPNVALAIPSDAVKSLTFSLILARASAKGTLYLGLPNYATIFGGGVDLTDATMGRVADFVTAKTKQGPDPSPVGSENGPVFLKLDGLNYTRFAERTDLSARARIAFLRLQTTSDLNENFKPHPWTQMVKVLREEGHIDAARLVAIEFEEARRQAGAIKSRMARLVHWLYGRMVGYGHKPVRLLKIAIVIWLGCGLFFHVAAMRSVFSPSNPLVFQNKDYARCSPDYQRHDELKTEKVGNWYWCKDLPAEYTTFNPYLYSLDLILPLVDLQQDKDWAPMIASPRVLDESSWWPLEYIRDLFRWDVWTLNHWVRIVMWLEILYGWTASLLFAAVAAGFIKRMDGE